MALLCKILIAVFILSAPLIFHTSSQILIPSSKANFGEFCNETTKCSKGAWLTCRNASCGCYNQNEMVWDYGKQKCVTKAGEHCHSDLAMLSRATIRTECVANAKCGVDGICTCERYYHESSSGLCIEQSDHGEPCTTNASCLPNKELSCIDGTCACDESLSEYSESDRQCVGLASKPCVGKWLRKCTPNADCSIYGSICTCSPPYKYFQNSGGRCEEKKEFGAKCVTNAECNGWGAFLQCINQTCSCSETTRYEDVTRKSKVFNSYEKVRYLDLDYQYDEVNDGKILNSESAEIESRMPRSIRMSADIWQCVGLADRPCNHKKNCVQYAECSEHENICECIEGYKKTAKGLCGLDFGSSCDKNNVCSDDFICTEGKCSCKDSIHQIYSNYNSDSKCIGLVAATCYNDSDCVPNAVCKFNDKNRHGRCYCDDSGSGFSKYVENTQGYCELAHGSPCEYKKENSEVAAGETCDSLAQLQCRNEKCSCPEESMIFDKESRQCLQLVGARCSENFPCIGNAICQRNHLGLSGICQCPEGFEEVSDGECDEIAMFVPEPLFNNHTTTIVSKFLAN